MVIRLWCQLHDIQILKFAVVTVDPVVDRYSYDTHECTKQWCPGREGSRASM